MIHIHDLRKQFGRKVIFDGASAHFPPGTRMGLVGPNGSGKTTLYRMLMGEEAADAGSIVIARGAQLGYLKQEVWENPDRSILAEVLSGFPELQTLERKLLEMEYRLAGNPNGDSLARYGSLRERFESLGGYGVEHEAKRILSGMGFKPDQFGLPLRSFSGGWRMRVALARLLVSRPDVLLLDEPTNHLDLQAIEWLESFLLDYPGTIVLTTHDQVFMQRIAQRIVEISQRKLHTFVGDFESFAEDKVARREKLEAQLINQQKKIQQTERFIERFRYKATKARQVQSRIKMLEKLERVKIEEEVPRVMRFRLPQPERSGQEVVRLRGVRKSYGKNVVYAHLDFALLRGEKVALVGPNGAGKSTLLRIIAGVTGIDTGAVNNGHNVTVEYYAQHQLENLNPSVTILDEISTVSFDMRPEQRRKMLGAFLFSGDEVFKTIEVLSGGEKARVALAKMLAQPANLLVMDEPTNHLDILSRQIIEEALADYEGTLIFVSHDRAFMNAVVNKIVEVRNGQLRSFPGNYDDYLWRREQIADGPGMSQDSGEVESEVTASARSRKQDRRLRAERLQRKSRTLRPLQLKLSELEENIATLEKEKGELLAILCDPQIMSNRAVYPQKLRRQREVETLLDQYLEEWAEVSERIERIEDEYGSSENSRH